MPSGTARPLAIVSGAGAHTATANSATLAMTATDRLDVRVPLRALDAS